MKLETSAGGFELVSFTDAFPLQVTISFEGEQIIRCSENDLSDLRYIAKQLQKKIKAYNKGRRRSDKNFLRQQKEMTKY